MQTPWRDFPFFETILGILLLIAFILTLGGLDTVIFGSPQHDSSAWESIEAPKDTELDCWRQKENHNNVICCVKHTC